MLHVLIPDSRTYLLPDSNAHPIPQLYYWLARPLGLEAAALGQMALICWAAGWMVKRLGVVRLQVPLFLLLSVPAWHWGRQIGSDAIGYAFFLLAMAEIGSHRRYILFAILATLCRAQYVALFAGFLLFRRTAWVAIVTGIGLIWLVGSGWMGTLGYYGKVRKTVDYVAFHADSKPEAMSHAEWFNMAWGGHLPEGMESEQERTEIKLYGPLGYLARHWRQVLTLIKSKVRYSFHFHDAALFGLLLSSSMWRETVVCLAMYAFVILTASPLYYQYTLMVEIMLIALGVKLYERLWK